jgi:hypothetical protein
LPTTAEPCGILSTTWSVLNILALRQTLGKSKRAPAPIIAAFHWHISCFREHVGIAAVRQPALVDPER